MPHVRAFRGLKLGTGTRSAAFTMMEAPIANRTSGIQSSLVFQHYPVVEGPPAKRLKFQITQLAMSSPGSTEFCCYWPSPRRRILICRPNGTT